MKGVTAVSTKLFLNISQILKKKKNGQIKLLPIRDATIIDFVDTIIVWGIIMFLWLLRLLCIY